MHHLIYKMKVAEMVLVYQHVVYGVQGDFFMRDGSKVCKKHNTPCEQEKKNLKGVILGFNFWHLDIP